MDSQALSLLIESMNKLSENLSVLQVILNNIAAAPLLDKGAIGTEADALYLRNNTP